jgi:hypothetical protein
MDWQLTASLHGNFGICLYLTWKWDLRVTFCDVHTKNRGFIHFTLLALRVLLASRWQKIKPAYFSEVVSSTRFRATDWRLLGVRIHDPCGMRCVQFRRRIPKLEEAVEEKEDPQ